MSNYTGLIKRLCDLASDLRCDDYIQSAIAVEDAADAIEELTDKISAFEAYRKQDEETIIAQAERIKQLEADAARYQWLREQWFLDDGWLQSTECAFLESPEEFDESIDAAMQKEQGK